MANYILSDLSIDLSGGDDFDLRLFFGVGRPAPNEVTVAVVSGATEISYGYTIADHPQNNDWATGTIDVRVLINTSSLAMFLAVDASRISATGTVLETSAQTAEQLLGDPIGYDFAIPSEDWDPGSFTDRLRINYHFRNDSVHGQASVKIAINSIETDVTTVIAHGQIAAGKSFVVFWDTIEKLTYYLSKIVPNLTGGDDFDATLLKFPEAIDKYSITVPNSTTDTSYAFTKAGSPFNDDWETGNFVIKVERVE